MATKIPHFVKDLPSDLMAFKILKYLNIMTEK